MSKQNENLPDTTIRHKQQQLYQAIEQDWQDLLPGIRVQIKKFNLATDRVSIEALAEDILNDTIVQALQNSEKYDPKRPVRPWLWTIALNKMRMLRRRQNYEDEHITLVGDDMKVREIKEKIGSEMMPEDEMFNLLYQSTQQSKYTLDDLLSLVKESDREILELVFVHGLRGKSLAAKLGISEGSAWMKQSRAIARLRDAYMQSERIFEEEK